MFEPDEDPEAAATIAVATAANLPEHYFDLYMLMVEMADRVSARRGTANAFFLTVNTGLVTLVGSTDLRWYVAFAGIVFSGTWWLLLRSYRRLNAAKFSVIIEMEERLPKQVFGDEYRHYRGTSSLGRVVGAPVSRANIGARLAAWTTRYRELGEVERVVPIVFAFIYVAELIRQITS
ncbi:MAG: hypothetical protein ABSG93_00765 [Solirubrobacteraceae bacterium]|jgi:hypothetical protein